MKEEVFDRVYWKDQNGKFVVHASLPDNISALCGKLIGHHTVSQDDPIECPECCNIMRILAVWGRETTDEELDENLCY